MADPTIDMANRMIGEEETRQVIEEVMKSGVKNEDFTFALMTRIAQRQMPGVVPTFIGQGQPEPPQGGWGVPPVPAGMQLPSGAQIPPQPMGTGPAPPPASGVESPLGSPPITAQTGYYREEGSSDTRRR